MSSASNALWTKLTFWFNNDVKLSIPSVAMVNYSEYLKSRGYTGPFTMLYLLNSDTGEYESFETPDYPPGTTDHMEFLVANGYNHN
jgi:hypothetical protein